MSTKYAIQFGFLSALSLFASLVAAQWLVLRVVLAWCSLSFAVVAIAYGIGNPRLLMKRRDGSQPLLAWLVLWPYFVLARLSLHVYRCSHRQQVAVAEVVPGVWFARRLTRREMEQSQLKLAAVLDLAAEFPRMAPPGIVYRSEPMLDGAVPTDAQLSDAVVWISDQAKRGNVLVHCALGHGRTGSVVLAWLLMTQGVSDVKSGMAHLRKQRSSFGLSRAQLAFLER